MAVFSKLKQFKDLRSQAKKLQNELSQETVHVEGINGKVQLIMDGNQHVLSVDIDPELLNPNNKEKLQNGMRDLFNDGVKKIQRKMAQKMAKDGNLDLSSLLKNTTKE